MAQYLCGQSLHLELIMFCIRTVCFTRAKEKLGDEEELYGDRGGYMKEK